MMSGLRWLAAPASDWWYRVEQRDELGDVVAVAPVNVAESGIPPPSQIRWCFEPVLARSTGLGLAAASPSPDCGRHPRTPATSRCAPPRELGQQHLVQPVVHSVDLPVPQPPAVGHPGAEPDFLVWSSHPIPV
jgi:hypothetical protein